LQEELSGRRGAPQGQNLFPAAGVIAGDSEELYVFGKMLKVKIGM
jgi:hypothetical protein